jgi:predicted RNA-binding protein with PUA-like domain
LEKATRPRSLTRCFVRQNLIRSGGRRFTLAETQSSDETAVRLGRRERGSIVLDDALFIGGKMASRYWLMKSEPSSYSIDDLKRDGTTLWDGVRNYQARNFMTGEMKSGHEAIFYHSNADPPAAVGVVTIGGPAEPDPTAFDPDDSHFDPKSTPSNPIWFGVRVRFKQKFARPVSITEMRSRKGLEKMVLLKKGSRLSIQPLTEREFRIVCELGSVRTGKGSRPK